MAVEASDIRVILKGITTSMVGDDAVTFWIEVATDVVEANIGEDVTTAKKERTIKLGAAFYTLQTYATYIQTSSGRIPNVILGQMQELSRAFSVLLSIISRADGPMAPPATVVQTTKTKWDE